MSNPERDDDDDDDDTHHAGDDTLGQNEDEGTWGARAPLRRHCAPIGTTMLWCHSFVAYPFLDKFVIV